MKIIKIAHHASKLLGKIVHKAKLTPVVINIVIVLVGAVIAGGILADWKTPSFAWVNNLFGAQDALSSDEAGAKIEQFIASSNLSGGKKAEVKEISDAGEGLYKVMVQLEGQQGLIESFVTKDGRMFFPQGMPIEN